MLYQIALTEVPRLPFLPTSICNTQSQCGAAGILAMSMLGPTSKCSSVRVSSPQIDAYRLVASRSVSPYSHSRRPPSSSEHHTLGRRTGLVPAKQRAPPTPSWITSPVQTLLASCVLRLRCRRHGDLLKLTASPGASTTPDCAQGSRSHRMFLDFSDLSRSS